MEVMNWWSKCRWYRREKTREDKRYERCKREDERKEEEARRGQ